VNLSSASETFFNGSVEDANRCLPDIRAHPIPFDIGDDGLIRGDQFPFRGISNLLSSHMGLISSILIPAPLQL
jgi:hypothetical protein